MLNRGMLVKAFTCYLDYVAAFNCVILHAPLGTGDRGRDRTSTHPLIEGSDRDSDAHDCAG
jgi:hypothetical protein